MASQAVYCLSLQIRNPTNSTDSSIATTNNANTTPKCVESSEGIAIQHSALQQPQLVQNQQQQHQLIGELNSNIILLRGTNSKQQKPGGDQILLQTLKRIDRSTPILLLRNNARVETGQRLTVTANTKKQYAKVKDEDATLELEEAEGNKYVMPIGSDGEPIKLPDNLESLPRAEHFPTQRHRWNTNEEIAAVLISFDRHTEWQSKEVKIRPKSGSMLLYSRKKVRYRRDGYCWKKRKDGKTTREDHMKLKVQGTECIYGCYVHSAILPTFHRRCYWLLQNPDIVLVHYLNVPYPDDNKMAVIAPSLALWGDRKEWTKEELVCQLKPMFFSEDDPDMNNDLEISTAETVETIVGQLMERQRLARQAALVRQLECGCPDSTCADGKSCSHPTTAGSGSSSRRPVGSGGQSSGQSNAAEQAKSHNSAVASGSRTNSAAAADNNNQVSSTTGTMLLNTNNHQQRVYASKHMNHNYHHAIREARLVTTSHASHQATGTAPPLVLSLSQIHGTGGLIILNNHHHQANATTATLQQHQIQQHHQQHTANQHQVLNQQNHAFVNIRKGVATIIPKVEAMDTCSRPEDPNANQQHQARNQRHQSAPTEFSAGGNKSEQKINHQHQQFSITDVNGFFDETLDLSHEDIQRTLSANMPRCPSDSDVVTAAPTVVSTETTSNDIEDPPGINPMDFIENCDVMVSPGDAADDDVFVNLDAFDMLGDFPDLEVLDATVRHPILQNENNTDKRSPPSIDFREGSASITDYSPEWAYPDGGVKVLVTGPWHSTSSPYTVLFDSFPVPTTLVQSGVLRCYCPAHEAGLASLQVACDGFVISDSVLFEYKLPPREARAAPEPETETETESTGNNGNEGLLKFSLLHRLEALDDRMQIKREQPEQQEDSALLSSHNFEDRLVTYCQNLSKRLWRGDMQNNSWLNGHKGMTLLHLAAALGYSRLVCSLLHWRTENSSLLLDTEIDALSRDNYGYTPLAWACSRGHTETAIILYRWNHTALNISNNVSLKPLECARKNNFQQLAEEIERLEKQREALQNSNNDSRIQNMNEFSMNTMESLIILNDNSNMKENAFSPSSTRSHDGVFLRPGAVSSASVNSNSSDQRNQVNGSVRLTKRPSVDSGIGLGSSERPRGKTTRDTNKLSRFDRSMSLPVNTNYPQTLQDLNNALSPAKRNDFSHCEPTSRKQSSEEAGSKIKQENSNQEAGGASVADANIVGEPDVRVLTLAEQIIAAMPERIKNEIEDMHLGSPCGGISPSDSLGDVFMEPLPESQSTEHSEFNFEHSDNNYRYYDAGTPCSSLSPASSSCLQSPASFTLDSPSPPPTTQDHCDFLHAGPFESDFNKLTLSDREQRELYEAAKTIQQAYRIYKGRQKLEEQDKERAAAILIQNYYRRYKQYAYFKQMTQAALVIQNGFRSYCEYKRYKKNQQAASCIQNYYRSYRDQGRTQNTSISRESAPSSSSLKRTYSQRRQHQAARKIQQFMRQSKNILQKERAEREKQSAQPDYQAAPQRSPHLVVTYQPSTEPNRYSEPNAANADDSRQDDMHFWGQFM